MKLELALCQVEVELLGATEKFGAFRSPHEGLAIIREEYTELEREVFGQFDERSMTKMRKEARQLAAMAIRFMVDLT